MRTTDELLIRMPEAQTAQSLGIIRFQSERHGLGYHRIAHPMVRGSCGGCPRRVNPTFLETRGVDREHLCDIRDGVHSLESLQEALDT